MVTSTSNQTPTALLAVARLAATAAGNHARLNSDRRHDANSVARHDIKHKLDVECQEIATQTILRAFPGHAVLGEETAGSETQPPASGVEWIIDPIDGTVNFFHGLPIWCCSVAARLDGTMQAGVVFAPEIGLVFEAASDSPARCNGELIHVSETDDLERAIVHTGCDKNENPARSFRFFQCIAGCVQRPRLFGSAALDICFVAAGKADAYFEHGIYLWDIAAAGLILERAGGCCETLKAHKGYRMAALASNGLLHGALRERLLAVM
ncbi:MAG: inositol monophosphatase [Kiritimatiellae bacterium]|nr:inositol monophosphatase [Kiritimatiellia bacterium]